MTGASRVASWAQEVLAREPSAARDLSAVRDASLDISAASVPAVEALMTEGRQRLSALARDADLRTGWLLRLRRFRLWVAELEDRGLTAGYLVSGVIDIDQAEVPVLLRRCRARPAGSSDALVELSGDWAVNPAAVTMVAGRTAGAVDLGTVDAPGSPGDDPADPFPVLDRVAKALTGTGLSVRRRLVVAPLTTDAGRAVADLERVRRWLTQHRILDAVSVAATGVPTAQSSPSDPSLPDVEAAVLDAAIDDLLALPLDPWQYAAVRDVLAGRHVAVDAAPATGATHVAAAVATLAATTGRRCLVLAPTRTQGDVLEERLHRLGLVDEVLRGTQPPPDPASRVTRGRVVDTRTARDHAQIRFAQERDELIRVRDPWQVSRLDVLDALARLDQAPPSPAVSWPFDGVTGAPMQIPLESVHRVVDAVVRAIQLGELDPGAEDSPWRPARIADPAAARQAVALAERIAGPLAGTVAAAIEGLATVTGTAPAVTLADLDERRLLFTGLQATLDKLTPEVFDVPIDDLVAATAPRESREADLPPVKRRRLVARARRMVRPGIDVKPDELHALLAAAASQRTQWQALSGGAGWAHVPAEVPQQLRAAGEFLDAAGRLGELHPTVRGTSRIDHVIALARDLVATEGEIVTLPERSRLRHVWVSRGLAQMVEDLFARLRDTPTEPASGRAPTAEKAEQARWALWRAWWTAVAAATQPVGDPSLAVTALRTHTDAVAAHRKEAARRAASAARSVAEPAPVRVAVPIEVADLPDGERYDVVVVDDAGALPFAAVVAAVARSAQVVAVGDLSRTVPASTIGVLRTAPASIVRPATLGWRHRPVAVPLAGGGGSEGPAEIELYDPARALTFTHVPDATGLPPEGDDYVDTSDAEVRVVVEMALGIAEAGWQQQPPRSLGVVALTRAHAAAIAGTMRSVLRANPERAAPFTAERDEPVVVVSADQARGLERDVVVLSVGFPRTPHGRVLHRFGPLDADDGESLVATAVTRSRGELHVVSGLRSGDLDPSRLRGRGARALSALLAGAELSGSAAAPRPGSDPPALPIPSDQVTAFSRRGGTSDGSWVRHLVADDLRERGLAVDVGPFGRGLTVTGPTGRLAVDLDVSFPDARQATAYADRLEEGGWPQVILGVEQVAAQRTATVDGLARHVGLEPPTAGSGPRRRRIVVPGGADSGSLAGADSDPGAEGGDTVGRQSEPAGRGAAVTVLPTDPADVAADDRDTGWGRAGDQSNDERLIADRPPHW